MISLPISMSAADGDPWHLQVDTVVFSTLLPTWNLETQSEMCFT